MKISGFTIIKNAVINDYPVVEAIESILPVVDEMIVLIGDCEDDTEALIRSIPSDKIKIHHSIWNSALRTGGAALADETNKAFALIDPKADWAFYIQADEVVHERYLPGIQQAAREFADEKKVEGLLFNYLHFYGTYDYIGDSRKWYDKEIRIIRCDPSISAYRDAQGFRKKGEKLKVKQIDAYIYHYGWVKSPKKMMTKLKNVARLWFNDQDEKHEKSEPHQDIFNYDNFDSLALFTQTHPAVMKQRIAAAQWHIEIDVNKKKFKLKDRFLYWFEQLTGKRVFSYRNYKVIR